MAKANVEEPKKATVKDAEQKKAKAKGEAHKEDRESLHEAMGGEFERNKEKLQTMV